MDYMDRSTAKGKLELQLSIAGLEGKQSSVSEPTHWRRGYQLAPHCTSEPAMVGLISSPWACSHCCSSPEVAGERQPSCVAVCLGTSGSMYATCTKFCHAEELFIIHCITAIEIYFAIRGVKKNCLGLFLL